MGSGDRADSRADMSSKPVTFPESSDTLILGSSRPSVWLTSNTVTMRNRVARTKPGSLTGFPSAPHSVSPVAGSFFSTMAARW